MPRSDSNTLWQPLNPLDIALRCIDLSIRGMGYPGFETQMLVWLEGRVDAALLARAVERLGRRHPVITARLEEPPGRPPGWRLCPAAPPQLNEVPLASDDPGGVLDGAAALLSCPRDPVANDPLRFHLLRRPGGGDVFLLQYSHVLMDNSATALLVRELDELAQEGGDDPPRYEPRNLVGRLLRSIPRAVRADAAQAAIVLQGHSLRGRAALLSTGEEDRPRQAQLKIAARALDPEATRAVRAGVIRACGLPNLSMALLACAFRGIGALGPPHLTADRKYMAGIGLDLNLRGGGGARLQNLLSLVPLNAPADDLADRDELVRLLSRQMRSRLEERIDLGVLRLAHVFQRRPRHIRWVMDHLLRWECSLWYAYFGSLDAAGPRLCGAKVQDVSYVGPAWSPLGIALLTNQYGGRLRLNLTYDPELVAPPLADSYLDHVLAELRALAER